MRTPKVYLETSVISAYFEERTDMGSLAQRFWTRQWWDESRPHYEVVSSQATVEELSSPTYPYSLLALELLKLIPKVSIEEEIEQIVTVYLQHRLMPNDPLGDALHLALASYHHCDYLLTWNCKHLANPNKFQQIRWCNQSLGLYVPILVTPNQLIGDLP